MAKRWIEQGNEFHVVIVVVGYFDEEKSWGVVVWHRFGGGQSLGSGVLASNGTGRRSRGRGARSLRGNWLLYHQRPWEWDVAVFLINYKLQTQMTNEEEIKWGEDK